MSNTTNTTVAAPARSWKEFGKMCCNVVWSYLTLPSRKLDQGVRWTAAKAKELYTKYVYGPVQAFIAKAVATIKVVTYGLAGTAAICAGLTAGLVYGGVFEAEDVKEAVIEVTPRSWLQAAYHYGISVPATASANTDNYVRRSLGL